MLSQLIDRISGLIEWIARALSAVAMLTLVPMMFLVAADVVGRYIFNSPIPGVFEINTNFFMILVVFFPMAYVHVHDEHVFISLFTDKLPPVIKKLLDTFSVTIGAVIYALIGLYGAKMAIKATSVLEYSPGIIDVPIWLAKWLVPIGAFVFCAELLISVAKHIRSIVTPSSP